MVITVKGGTIMKNILLTCFSVLSFFSLSVFAKSGIIYRNPRVYNVDYMFELCPDPNKIDRDKDLRLWIPISCEWASQKAVKIISVEPKPYAEYTDPESGNRMLFWDFSKEPKNLSYEVHIKFRLESYEVHAEVDPNQIGSYNKTSKEYALYTRSENIICITPEIREMAQKAVGDEKNPYLQAKLINKFVGKKMRFKIHRQDRGVGVKCLLDFPVIDKKGEKHYEGSCEQYSALFVALCRAAGIPARTVAAFIGWCPWIEEEDLEKRYGPLELQLSPDGLAAAQHYMGLGLHTWAEFYVPKFGWVPVDPETGVFGHLQNTKLIISKGRDVQIGPQAPEKPRQGYGSQWIPLSDGRVDLLRTGVFNIAKIRKAKVKMFHHSDPFPADAFADYMANGYPMNELDHNFSREKIVLLASVDDLVQTHRDGRAEFAILSKEHPQLRYELEPFLCHMLRQVVGDEPFFDIYETYLNERAQSDKPVSTERFKKIVEQVHSKPLTWFWDQWLPLDSLPQLKLHNIQTVKENGRWRVQGILSQAGETIFRLPVRLQLRTNRGRQNTQLWLKENKAVFEFRTSNRPRQLVVDPEYDILKIQKMPPLLRDIWKSYPNYLVIYGTAGQTESNKALAERFSKGFFRISDRNVVMADTDVNDADLQNKSIILFGGPKSNRITERFKDLFQIRFNGKAFFWQGQTYDKSTQGIAQVVEHPEDPKLLMLLYAGLSESATQELSDSSYFLDAAASYVIFERDKELEHGLWLTDKDLFWTFEQ
jgi:transglutaminase-like putative cysteine protease